MCITRSFVADWQTPARSSAREYGYIYQLHWSSVRLNLGAGVGLDFVWQEVPALEDRLGIGFLTEVVLGLAWVFADPMLLAVSFRGGFTVQKHYDSYSVRPRLSGCVGVGFIF